MGMNKPCTHLYPPPPSSLQHPQRYKNQNIAHNWAISSNLGRTIESCPFCLKLSTLGFIGGADFESGLKISKF